MSACWRQTGKEAAGQRVFKKRATAHPDSDRRLFWSALCLLPPRHLKPLGLLLLYGPNLNHKSVSTQHRSRSGTHFLQLFLLLFLRLTQPLLSCRHLPLPPSHVSLRLYRPPCSGRCKHLCSIQHFSVSHK